MATTQHRWTRIIKRHQAKVLSLRTGSKRESTEMKKDKAEPWPRLTFLKNTRSWWTVKALIFPTLKTTPSTESSAILTTTCPKHKIISIFVFIRSYGKGANKADQFAKTGRKQQLVEQMVLLVTYFFSICNKSRNNCVKSSNRNRKEQEKVCFRQRTVKHLFLNLWPKIKLVDWSCMIRMAEMLALRM